MENAFMTIVDLKMVRDTDAHTKPPLAHKERLPHHEKMCLFLVFGSLCPPS